MRKVILAISLVLALILSSCIDTTVPTPQATLIDQNGDLVSVNLGSGSQGPAGATGPQGPAGAAGPNTVSANTTTDLSGILTGDGANVGAIALSGDNNTFLNGMGAFSSPLGSSASLELINALAVNLTWSGITSEFTVGAAVSQFDICYIDPSSHLVASDASAAATMPVVALATTAIVSGSGSFLTYGYVRDDAWTWTVNGLIFASDTPGQMTQTAPSGTGKQVQVVGIAITSQIILFAPQMTILGLS